MIKEALEYLSGLSAKALTPIPLPSDDRVKRFAIGGRLETIEVGTPPRQHEPDSLIGLIDLANRFQETGQFAPVVWYDEDSVVLVIDDDGHRLETATLRLEISDLFLKVVDLRSVKPWFPQKDFVRLLKVDLAGTLPEGTLLGLVRKIKIENGQTMRGEVLRGRESMGKEINASVSGEAEIPDQVTLQVPVYKNLGERDAYPLRCSVEVDPTRIDPFRLLPMPDEVERVQHLAMQSIGERLASSLDEGIPSYYGRP